MSGQESPLRANVRLIKSIMAREGLTQAELGRRIGYSRAGVSLILAGERQPTRRFVDGLMRIWPDLHWSDLFFYPGCARKVPPHEPNGKEEDHAS